jgi:hypothetical protein
LTSRKSRKARAPEAAAPFLTPQAFLEGLYALSSGQRMPDGVYGWLAHFSDVIDAAHRGVWSGQPWTGGDPLAIPGFGRGTYDGENTYAVISAFRPEQDGDMGRRKALYVAGFAVMLDDLGTKVEMKRGLALPPSYLVETSPNNFQSWLFFAEPIEAREEHEALLDALVRSGLSLDGTDPGMRGVTRYGRMPFGVNTKRKYGPGGFKVRLHEWAPGRRYGVEEIVAAYGLKLEPPRKTFAGPAPSPEKIGAARQEFATLLRAVDRLGLYKREQRNGWHSITCPWADEHTDGREDGAAIAEPNEANGWRGGYRCHHGHCDRRGLNDVRWWLIQALTERVRSTRGAK